MWNWIKHTEEDRTAHLLSGLSEPVLGEKLYLNAEEWQQERWRILHQAPSGRLTFEQEEWFLEHLSGQPKLYICGGGHVSLPIIGLARKLGFYVTVFEDRPFFADQARLAGADRVVCDDFAKSLSAVSGDADSYFVIITRGHRYDQVCLRKILPLEKAYVGMMGSRRRVAIVKQELLADFSAERVDSLRAPIGLSIGAETPEEIAVSIMAEVISVKNSLFRTEGFTTEILEALACPGAKALATIIGRKGSAPRAVGTKMVVFADGGIKGTVGGGCAEAEVIRAAREQLLRGGGPQIYHVDMTADQAEEEGMVCGGTIDVLVEPVPEAAV
ncbi:MAG: XdhC/CoxI family protein [Lachnospiraceae bacterium]|nr:XdhC family protein [Lachnospiraceae bacterium]MDY5741379.1 XdhC/CoxI family protein [Lachnospiraceae bacterium]